jgi:catechol 2,3-dioxygenase-like lactoylglutathione lyase family enzyme
MIGYVSVGTNDLKRAGAFYDAVLKEIGASRLRENERYVAWGTDAQKPSLAIIVPFDGKPATAGNGTMVALFVDGQDQVRALHARALSLGGKDEGAPGPRGTDGAYAAYFRDLDGNKLAAFHIARA